MFCDSFKYILRVGILLTCDNHFHDRIVKNRKFIDLQSFGDLFSPLDMSPIFINFGSLPKSSPNCSNRFPGVQSF